MDESHEIHSQNLIASKSGGVDSILKKTTRWLWSLSQFGPQCRVKTNSFLSAGWHPCPAIGAFASQNHVVHTHQQRQFNREQHASSKKRNMACGTHTGPGGWIYALKTQRAEWVSVSYQMFVAHNANPIKTQTNSVKRNTHKRGGAFQFHSPPPRETNSNNFPPVISICTAPRRPAAELSFSLCICMAVRENN